MEIGVLFDLDGTLLDTLEDLHDGVNHVLAQFGYPLRTLEEIRRFVGNGARRLMEQAVPAGEDAQTAYREFQSYYASHCQIKTRPYDGILDALQELSRRYPTAIVSNKPDVAVKELCAVYFPGVYARGESADCPRKPAPDMVYRAMEAIGVKHCVYVGDSDVDVRTARNAGAVCLSVLWGFRDRMDLEAVGGKYFCNTPQELPRMIDKLIADGIFGAAERENR